MHVLERVITEVDGGLILLVVNLGRVQKVLIEEGWC